MKGQGLNQTAKNAHDRLKKLLDNPNASNDDIRDCAIDLCGGLDGENKTKYLVSIECGGLTVMAENRDKAREEAERLMNTLSSEELVRRVGLHVDSVEEYDQ